MTKEEFEELRLSKAMEYREKEEKLKSLKAEVKKPASEQKKSK